MFLLQLPQAKTWGGMKMQPALGWRHHVSNEKERWKGMKVWTNASSNSKCGWQKHLGPGVAPAVAASPHVFRGIDSNDNCADAHTQALARRHTHKHGVANPRRNLTNYKIYSLFLKKVYMHHLASLIHDKNSCLGVLVLLFFPCRTTFTSDVFQSYSDIHHYLIAP